MLRRLLRLWRLGTRSMLLCPLLLWPLMLLRRLLRLRLWRLLIRAGRWLLHVLTTDLVECLLQSFG